METVTQGNSGIKRKDAEQRPAFRTSVEIHCSEPDWLEVRNVCWKNGITVKQFVLDAVLEKLAYCREIG